MAEIVVIDVDERGESGRKPSVKRQRVKLSTDVLPVTPEEREAKIGALNEELQSLFKYFKETVSENSLLLESHYASCSSSNVNAMIALLLEGKSASYSTLGSEIYKKVKERESTVTIASVKSSVLYIGQRSSYGVCSDNVDVLEDETESCLWCWETRDMKFFPSSTRGALKVHRTCRKRISERITAVLTVLLLLQNPSDCQNYKNELRKASEKLGKVLNEPDIRFLVKSLTQKNDLSAEKEAKREEKLLAKQLEKNRREEEKEKKRMDRELQKEKLQSEKEIKRLQEEAEKEEKRREKEDSEIRKQLKRKQEEMERDQRRREKEEAEQKKKRSLQKQASIMQRFLQRKKHDLVSQNARTPSDAIASDLSGSGKMHQAVTLSMDDALLQNEQIDMEEMRKAHLNSWRRLGHAIRSRSRQHWGIRHKPKTVLVQELKISTNKGSRHEEELNTDSLVGGWGETALDGKACNADVNFVIRKCRRSKQLVQFDKSYRPAFYGVWPKKSHIVGARHPFKKDPELDYDIDSDEEWEEDEPGESLSECDKDDEENLEEGSLKADDEDESDDGFFVPDGYLSENEGVHSDGSRCYVEEDDIGTSPSSMPEAESEEFSCWVRQLKHLHNLTEHALRKNQPVIITNMMHEKAHLLSSDNLTGASKIEQMFLQALAMRAFPGGLIVEVHSDDNLQKEDQEACIFNNKNNLLLAGSVTPIPDSDLFKIASTIQSCPYGMNKVLESLQLKFPNYSKSQLRNKVREISEFVDNKWQVKKEILDKLGLSSSPEKTGARTKSIAAFFSKRCLPPSRRVDRTTTSPESSQKVAGSQEQQPTEIHPNEAPI